MAASLAVLPEHDWWGVPVAEHTPPLPVHLFDRALKISSELDIHLVGLSIGLPSLLRCLN